MTALNPQLLVVALALTAGLLMLAAGSAKKLLRWKPAERRCVACGRRDSYRCPCRR